MSSEHERTNQLSDEIAELYESHYERVVRYIYARMGDVSEAENLASEVFVRALRSADTFRDTGAPLEAWIFRISRNITIDYLRARGRRPASQPIEKAFDIRADDDPAEDAERADEAEMLRSAMEELTEAQQEVLRLRFAAQMTSTEVAEAMGRRPGAVREMQSAAIKKLREVLTERSGILDSNAG